MSFTFTIFVFELFVDKLCLLQDTRHNVCYKFCVKTEKEKHTVNIARLSRRCYLMLSPNPTTRDDVITFVFFVIDVSY